MIGFVRRYKWTTGLVALILILATAVIAVQHHHSSECRELGGTYRPGAKYRSEMCLRGDRILKEW